MATDFSFKEGSPLLDEFLEALQGIVDRGQLGPSDSFSSTDTAVKQDTDTFNDDELAEDLLAGSVPSSPAAEPERIPDCTYTFILWDESGDSGDFGALRLPPLPELDLDFDDDSDEDVDSAYDATDRLEDDGIYDDLFAKLPSLRRLFQLLHEMY